jgi:signal transduction histidine kinase
VPRLRLVRTGSFRLAVAYLGLFTLSALILGAVIFVAVRREAMRDIDERIREETYSLTREFAEHGRDRLAAIVSARNAGAGAFAYGLTDPSGARIAGDLDPRGAMGAPFASGWGSFSEPDRDKPGEDDARDTVRALATRLRDGSTLIVGDEWDSVDRAGRQVLAAFAWALAVTLTLGVAGGFLLSAHALRRIDAISAAARAIVAGDWRRRLPLGGAKDDLADLARTFNGLFDRIEQLLLANKHAGEAIAHDLRKPLAGALRRLESLAQARDDERDAIATAAMADILGVLDTFNALLRISQIEAGARRAAFRPVSLASVARDVVEAFAPAAEDEHKAIACAFDGNFDIVGDRELLTQMLANCVDNAVRHTPQGTHIFVEGRMRDGRGVVSVTDDGPGVPAAEHAQIFERFHRLDAARATPGAGLGLSLVAAVAELHGMSVCALDNAPGLRIEFTMPETSS